MTAQVVYTLDVSVYATGFALLVCALPPRHLPLAAHRRVNPLQRSRRELV